jgi:transporter family protein
MPYILAAILSNLSYALADNASGLVAKRNGPLKVALWSAMVGTLVFALPLFLFFQSEIAKLTWSSIAWILGTGAMVALGYWTFITGMHKGSVTVTGVVGGSFPAVTTIVTLLFFHELISWLQAIAIIIILVGIVFSSISTNFSRFRSEFHSSSIVYAFVTFLLWGIYYAIIRIPINQVGWFLPQYGSNIIALPIFLLIGHFSGEENITARPQALKFLIFASVIQICGSMLFNYALTQGPTSIVAPIAGSSPAVFVVLAYFIFKEKLGTYQKIGIVTAIIGIVGLSIVG